MHPARVGALLLAAVVAAGCSAARSDIDPAGNEGLAAATGTASPSESATVTPSPTPEAPLEAGRGSVTIDGVTFRVRGECDVFKDHGAAPVVDLEDPDVAVMVVLDNFTEPGRAPNGPFPFRLELTGGSDRGIDLRGAEVGDVRYRGAVEVIELRDRADDGFTDHAILAFAGRVQRVTAEADAPADRRVSAEIGCLVSG